MAVEGLEKFEDMIVRAAETTAAHARAAKAAIGAVIFGQEQVVERALITILSGGHALLVGVPGLAKTKLVETMGTVLGLDARRIQFTPDLMPSDILGSEVLEESAGGKRSFRFISGPGLRAAADGRRDQPRLARARSRRCCRRCRSSMSRSPARATTCRAPFHVLATQNPLEQEGTYPLPEAQLDRFLMEIDVDYPDREAERQILFDTTGAEETKAEGRDDRRRPDGGAAAGAPPAGRRVRGRGDPRAGALGASGAGRRRDRQADRLGPGPARQPGADAGGARPRAARRALRALGRRRARARRAGPEAPHGAHLRGARRRRDHRRRDRASSSRASDERWPTDASAQSRPRRRAARDRRRRARSRPPCRG